MKQLFALLPLACLLCSPAYATRYTFEYTAKVRTIAETPDTFGMGERVAVQSTTLPGAQISVNDVVKGVLSYDSDMPNYGVDNSWGLSRVSYDTSGVRLTANFAPSNFGFTPNSYIWALQTTSPDSADSFSVGAYRYAAGGASQEVLSLSFTDDTHTKLDVSVVPGSVLTSLAIVDGLHYEFGGAAGRAYINSELTSLTFITPVPEPETYAMLMAGLALIGWRGRRAGKGNK
ncbi:MAG TPA: PEP-CTERM sorting domain-containing protein [Duganella sp.]|nr:PEP-CTERM sorting domain-containing protein [Duganella sp.]